MIDHILNALKNDSQLLIFVSKNLSWNVFQAALEQKCLTEMSDFMINISN